MSDIEITNTMSQPLQGDGDPSKGPTPEDKPTETNRKRTGIDLTGVEGLLFFNIVAYITDLSVVDWDQVAIASNLKNSSSAKVRPFHFYLGCPL